MLASVRVRPRQLASVHITGCAVALIVIRLAASLMTEPLSLAPQFKYIAAMCTGLARAEIRYYVSHGFPLVVVVAEPFTEYKALHGLSRAP